MVSPPAILLAFSLGLATAAAWVWYIRAVQQHRASRAAVADFGIMLLGSFGLQVWALTGESFMTLLAFDVGGAVGTYVLVARGVK